jgi:hypothetical protein
MKKFIVAAVAFAAFAPAALAERSYDLRDSDTYFGKYSNTHGAVDSFAGSQALAIAGDSYLQGRFGLTKDPLEVRRWDEKNN